MDDLDVIRLAVIDNITRERIARARMEVKENFGDGGGDAASGLPGPSSGFPLVRGGAVLREKRLSHGDSPNTGKQDFHGCWLISRRNLCLRKEGWNR